MRPLMTPDELRQLTACYIYVEGYTDLRSIYYVMSQEYPGEFERKQALQIIREVLKEEGQSDCRKYWLKDTDSAEK